MRHTIQNWILSVFILASCKGFVSVDSQSKVSDAALSYVSDTSGSDTPTFSFSIGSAQTIKPSKLSLSSSDAVLSCNASPDLPSGIQIENSTCIISIAASASALDQTYTVTLKTRSGKTLTAKIRIVIQTSSLKLSLSLPTSGSSVATYDCNKVNVKVQDSSGTDTAVTSDVTVNLTGKGSGNFYANFADCVSAAASDSIKISAGSSSGSFYYRSSSAASLTLTASSSGYTSGTFALTVNLFQVIGQADTTSNSSGTTATSLNTPRGVYSDGTRLFIGDAGNNRVLIWNTIPISNTTPADVVLGQPDMTSNTANNGGASASSLKGPSNILVYNGKLYVSDQGNNRILVWNTIPTTNKAPADFVIGQPSMSGILTNYNTGGAVVANGLYNPGAMAVIGNRFYVVDESNTRVLGWNTIPTSAVAADFVIGQNALTYNQDNNGPGDGTTCCAPTAQTLRWAEGMCTDGTKLVISDSWNGRILIFNSIPTTTFAAADNVLGMANLTSYSGGADPGVSASKNWNATGCAIVNGKLIVADDGHNRTLVWNSVPSGINTPADAVIGQPDFVSGGINNPSLSYNSRKGVLGLGGSGVWSNGAIMYMADTGNHRVIVSAAP